MRLAGWLISIIMHLAAVLLLVFVGEFFRPPTFSYDQVYEVDLVKAREQAHEPEIPMPVQQEEQPPEPEPPSEKAVAPEPPPQEIAEPEPAAQVYPPARSITRETASAEPLSAAAGPAIEPAPEGVIRIPGTQGVVKVSREEYNRRLANWSQGTPQQNAPRRDSGIETAEESKAFAERLQSIRVIQKKIQGREGEEASTRVIGAYGFAAMADSASLGSIAYGEYTTADYIGHYSIFGGGYVSIIDAGRDYQDKLILHDHASGLTRTLINERGKIYSYGPNFGIQEPTAGTVTFMPKKEGMEHIKKYLTGHLFWLPEKPPMRYCKKVLFEPEHLSVPVDRGAIDAFVISPEGLAKAAVVWAPGTRCMSENATMAVAETLALEGVAVMGYAPGGCKWPEDGGKPAGDAFARADELLAAVRALRGRPGYEDIKIGVWGEAAGAAEALIAAEKAPELDFVVLSVYKRGNEAPPEALDEGLARIRPPLLVIMTGGDAAGWVPFRSALSGLEIGERIIAAGPREGDGNVRNSLDRNYLSQAERFGEHLDKLLAGAGR